jgi:hypothetical protein
MSRSLGRDFINFEQWMTADRLTVDIGAKLAHRRHGIGCHLVLDESGAFRQQRRIRASDQSSRVGAVACNPNDRERHADRCGGRLPIVGVAFVASDAIKSQLNERLAVCATINEWPLRPISKRAG